MPIVSPAPQAARRPPHPALRQAQGHPLPPGERARQEPLSRWERGWGEGEKRPGPLNNLICITRWRGKVRLGGIMIPVILALSLVAVSFISTPVVQAHGEHNLEPFVRMRGVSFFNVEFSHERLAVNETMTVTGKFRVMNSWPRMLTTPELAWIGVLVPGPKLAVRERWVNDRFIQNAFNIELGESYDFKMILQAREPGRYHVHPLVNLSGTGGLVGPAKWVTVVPGDGPPSYTVQIPATGETIDLEHYGFGRVVGWHIAFGILGLAWLGYWARRPLLVRYALLVHGVDEEQITSADRRTSLVFGVVLVVLVVGGLLVTNSGRPPIIPHQAARMWDLSGLPVPRAVQTEVKELRYNTTERALSMQVEATNTSDQAVVLRKFTTSYLSFINPATQDLYPDAQSEIPVMRVEPDGLLQPGETKMLTLTMQDAVWETDRFIEFDQPQITAAGVLVFTDAQPLAVEDLQPIMMGNSREGLGVPWEHISSLNEVYSNIQIDFSGVGK